MKGGFANHRQLEQYLNLFLNSWKIRKNRDGFTFECFCSNSNRNYAIKNIYVVRKETSIKNESNKYDILLLFVGLVPE